MKLSPWRTINKSKLLERFAIEIGPTLAFLIGLQAASLAVATAVFFVATAAAALYSWFVKRHFPYMPAGMVILAGVFGGFTILSDDASYLQFRATVVNAGGALAILIGLVFGRLFLKRSLQAGFQLTDDVWRTLSIRMALYFLLMALLNEVIWRNFSTEVWAWSKVAAPVLNLLFLGLQWPLIRDNLSAEADRKVEEERDSADIALARRTQNS
ncbi:septation protein IspZ [Aurantimonas sp. A2-1-M11]|uniref:inner membrane-spanning protein YciB n=1 Tax=Aurantimonas sp. A2-1-M11 TaxID=3113712 RepID=UPI002F94B3EE